MNPPPASPASGVPVVAASFAGSPPREATRRPVTVPGPRPRLVAALGPSLHSETAPGAGRRRIAALGARPRPSAASPAGRRVVAASFAVAGRPRVLAASVGGVRCSPAPVRGVRGRSRGRHRLVTLALTGLAAAHLTDGLRARRRLAAMPVLPVGSPARVGADNRGRTGRVRRPRRPPSTAASWPRRRPTPTGRRPTSWTWCPTAWGPRRSSRSPAGRRPTARPGPAHRVRRRRLRPPAAARPGRTPRARTRPTAPAPDPVPTPWRACPGPPAGRRPAGGPRSSPRASRRPRAAGRRLARLDAADPAGPPLHIAGGHGRRRPGRPPRGAGRRAPRQPGRGRRCAGGLVGQARPRHRRAGHPTPWPPRPDAPWPRSATLPASPAPGTPRRRPTRPDERRPRPGRSRARRRRSSPAARPARGAAPPTWPCG